MELTDAEKIDKLWESLEKSRQSEASVQALLEVVESKASKQEQIIQKQQATIAALSDEIRRLGVELNAAREAAASAVRDYIANKG